MSGIMSMLLGAVSSAAAAVDEFFNRVTLLLPGNGTNGAQNNTFLDSSSNNFTITRNGNTTQGTFSPFSQTGWSNFASATSGSVGFSNSTAALVGSTASTFTAECWIYMTEAPVSGDGVPALIGMDATFNSSIYLGFGPNASRNLVLRWFDGASKTATGGTTLALNTWYHIAVVANSNALAMYVNGVAETLSGTTTLTNRNGTTNTFSLFMNSSSSNYQFRGYASNIRVCTSAVYTSGFTPSTTALTTTSQGATNCKLLTAQDNRFIDNSTNAYVLTLQSTPSVQAFSPFAPTAAYSAATVGGSGYFDGTGDYLTWSGSTVGTNTFVAECWFYLTNTAFSAQYGLFGASTSNGLGLRLINTTTVNVDWLNINAQSFTLPATLVVGNWYHIAAVRNSSNQTTVFLNGARSTTGAVSVTINFSGNTTAIGLADVPANYGPMFGYISNARLLIGGTPIYDPTQSTITVPTAPLTAITNTQLLLNFTNAGITDATAKNALETVGNAQISTTQSKFGGSSMYFDGTGDYLQVAPNPLFDLKTSDFTVEFWIYPTSFGSTTYPLYSQFNRSTTNAFAFEINTSGTVFVYVTNAGGAAWSIINAGNIGTLTLNTWNHVAFVRNGSAFRGYVNGTQGSLSTNSSNTIETFNGFNIGATGAGTSGYFTGYIDDFRISRYARYTASFTAPTAAFPLQ